MEKQLGFNVFTIGFIGTAIMTILTTWGFYKQKQAIANNPKMKGQSVSVVVFIFLTGISIVQLAYAKFENWDIALIFNGIVRGIAYPLIVIAIWKVRRFNLKEVIVLLITTVISIISLFSARPDLWFISMTAVVLLMSLDQPWQIHKERNSGVVSIKLLLTLLISTAFWTIYAFVTNMWVMKFVSPSYLVIVLLTIGVWWIYRDKKQEVL